MFLKKTAVAIALVLSSAIAFGSEVIGEVSTSFQMVGPNDKIVVTAFDDPAVKGVACYLSSSKRGGVSGAIGFSADSSDAGVACRKIGPISFDDSLKNGQEVFSAKRSILFKELHVVRFIDKERKMLI